MAPGGLPPGVFVCWLTQISADTEQAVDPIRGVSAHPEREVGVHVAGCSEVGMA